MYSYSEKIHKEIQKEIAFLKAARNGYLKGGRFNSLLGLKIDESSVDMKLLNQSIDGLEKFQKTLENDTDTKIQHEHVEMYRNKAKGCLTRLDKSKGPFSPGEAGKYEKLLLKHKKSGTTVQVAWEKNISSPQLSSQSISNETESMQHNVSDEHQRDDTSPKSLLINQLKEKLKSLNNAPSHRNGSHEGSKKQIREVVKEMINNCDDLDTLYKMQKSLFNLRKEHDNPSPITRYRIDGKKSTYSFHTIHKQLEDKISKLEMNENNGHFKSQLFKDNSDVKTDRTTQSNISSKGNDMDDNTDIASSTNNLLK